MSLVMIEKKCKHCNGTFEKDDFSKCIYCDVITCWECIKEHFMENHYDESTAISDSEFEGLDEK